MSRSLLRKLDGIYQRYLIKVGEFKGKASLISTLGKSERTLQRWLAVGPPNEFETRRFALACEATEQEATALAREFASHQAQAG